jgi:pyrimidine-nucleoside phosphorylase
VNAVEVISKKRDGQTHSEEELQWIANGAAKGTIPDYQLSAWLMAAFLNPLNEQETAWLTRAMAESGERIDLSGLPKPWVDKHSTGGVGDKTTLVLLPMLAACGLTVVKMSGRGLGITGGTVDKLASIPGLRLDLSPNEMKAQAAAIGLALTGQSPNLAPADKALYALRDVTATVESVPLIVSSILSKKIAGGADTILLDVKCGSGAFMTDLDQARRLAQQLVRTGSLLGLGVRASISDMAQPLGAMVGNALEVREALFVLRGDDLSSPSKRFRELCLHYAGEALHVCGKAPNLQEGLKMSEESLSRGAALDKFKEWITAQGGVAIWEEDAQLPSAPIQHSIPGKSGYVAKVDAETIGHVVVEMGGGRKTKEAKIDPSVGIELCVCVGSKVQEGEPIAILHAKDQRQAKELEATVREAFEFSQDPVEVPPLVLESF